MRKKGAMGGCAWVVEQSYNGIAEWLVHGGALSM